MFSGPYGHLGGPQGPKYFCGIFSIFFRDPTGTWEVPRAPNIFVEFLVFFSGPYMHLGGPQGPKYFCGIFSIFFRDPTGTWEVPRAPIIFVEFLVFFSGPYGHLGGPQGPNYFCGIFSIFFSGPYGHLGGPVAGGSHVPEPRPKSIICLNFYNGNRPCRPQIRILRENLGGVSGCR